MLLAHLFCYLLLLAKEQVVPCSKCIKIIMEEHHVLWVLSLRTSELMHKINNTLLTTLCVDLCFVGFQPCKTLAFIWKIHNFTSFDARQRLCSTIKKGKCQICACFSTCPGSPQLSHSHTIIWELVAQKGKETILSDNGHSRDDMYFPREVMAAEPVVAWRGQCNQECNLRHPVTVQQRQQ